MFFYIIWRIFRYVKHFGGFSAKIFNMSEYSIGRTIRALRKNKKLTQAELGKVLGYSARTVSDWENDCTEPNIVAIKSLVKFFEITYDEFFED